MTAPPQTVSRSPYRCSICGQAVLASPPEMAADAACPPCDRLLRWFQQRRERTPITTETPFFKLAHDSIDYVELVMALEEEFDQVGPGEGEMVTMTVGDLIRYVRARQPEGPSA